MHDGSESGEATYTARGPSTLVSCSIEDNYEMPVDEITRQATAWLAWSGRTFGHDAIGAADGSEAAESTVPARMSYRRSPGVINTERSLLEGFLPLAMLTPMTVACGLLIWATKSGNVFLVAWMPWWGMMIGVLLIIFVPLIGALALVDPSLNRLDLSEEALVMARMGRTSRWAWREIQPVELRMVRTKWSAKQRAVLTVGVPAARLGSRYLRWAHNLDGHETLTVIEDIYDTPLDDIQTALNDYRRRFSGRPPPRAAG